VDSRDRLTKNNRNKVTNAICEVLTKIPFSRWAEEMDESPNFQVQPYTLEILLEAEGLSTIRDPADRVIVATARHLGCALISADEAIQDEGWVETVWE